MPIRWERNGKSSMCSLEGGFLWGKSFKKKEGFVTEGWRNDDGWDVSVWISVRV